MPIKVNQKGWEAKQAEEVRISGQHRVRLAEIELDWQALLPLLGPRTFTSDFGEFQAHYWRWYWSAVRKRRMHKPLSLIEQVYLAIWGRGMAKSSTVEWSSILEGAFLGEGYVLYISETQDLADMHVDAIQNRLESEEIGRFYPGLAEAKRTKNQHSKGWRQGFLHTRCGWGIAAYGLDQNIRGNRLEELRPSMIILDDIDNRGDSIDAVKKKRDKISRNVLPAGTPKTLILFAQNLIHKNSVLNRILDPKEDGDRILQRRTVGGPVKALEGLRIEQQGLYDTIVEGKPTWPAFDMEACQVFLSNSGRESFEAEYNHNMDADRKGLIIKEFNAKVHLITWSEFKAVYGFRSIPRHWKKDVGLDWGATGKESHPTCVSGVTTSAEDSRAPGFHFLWFGLSFDEGVLPHEVAEAIREALGQRRSNPDVMVPELIDCSGIEHMRMSHEAATERNAFRRLYGMHFVAGDSGKLAGITTFRQYLKVDYKSEHPFRPGARGYSRFYWIVEDDQLDVARDDRGLQRHREEILDWRWAPEKITDAGISDSKPVKFREDAMDSLRMITQKWMPPVAPKTMAQRIEDFLPEALRMENEPDDPDRREGWHLHRLIKIDNARSRAAAAARAPHWLDGEVPSPAKEREWERVESERIM